ncbi:MAG TPA: VOC family protein [Bryobacteraceae bacterium]|nr:VOC family protein [Bryobacteraceae bacterium]
MTVKRMTTNLYTDDVAACVKFWVERMHFEKTAEVPEPGGLAFAILQKGNIELMYGSYSSLQQEPLVAGAYQKGTGTLFVEVDDLNPVLEAMQDVAQVAPIHQTFYGSTEFTVKDPAGHLITFAYFAPQGKN